MGDQPENKSHLRCGMPEHEGGKPRCRGREAGLLAVFNGVWWCLRSITHIKSPVPDLELQHEVALAHGLATTSDAHRHELRAPLDHGQ
jgi:hypothetical protein